MKESEAVDKIFPESCEMLRSRFAVGELLVARPNARVYKGKDQELGGIEVAIKIFNAQPDGNSDWISRFSEEAAALRSVSHHVLVPIVDAGADAEFFYLVMEYINGPTLRESLRERTNPLPIDDAAHVFCELAAGIAELHEAGLWHGCIDAHAVMFKIGAVRLAGYCPRVIAEIQASKTSNGQIGFDPAYVAPELISATGQGIDGRADIYSLSLLFYEMLCGQKAFSGGNPLALAMKRITAPVPSPVAKRRDISPLLDAVIQKGLAVKPEERFDSIRSMIDAVSNACKQVSVHTHPLSASETIGVSMSSDKIAALLKAHEASQTAGRPTAESETASDDSSVRHGAVSSDHRPAKPPNDETAMHLTAAQLLPPSLAAVSGPLRSTVFALQADKLLLGSGENCDIRIVERDVPASYLLFVRTERGARLECLSSRGVLIGEEQIGEGQHKDLERGDIIHVGGSQLRYVAPGEVFSVTAADSVRANSASRSRVHSIFALLSIGVAILCSTVIYYYYESIESQTAANKKRLTSQAKERSKRIDELIAEGDAALRAGRLDSPPGDNALEAFRAAIELDSGHQYAWQRVHDIERKVSHSRQLQLEEQRLSARLSGLLSDAARYIEEGKLVTPVGSNARDVYLEVLKLDSNNAAARAGLDKIRSLQEGLEEQLASLFKAVEERRAQRRYVTPEDDSAYSVLQKILRLSPGNERAVELLRDLAAEVVYFGDVRKAKGQVREMDRFYLAAEIMGVSPSFLANRRRGAELLNRARSSAVVVSAGNEDSGSAEDSVIKSAEIEERLKQLELRYGLLADGGRLRIVE